MKPVRFPDNQHEGQGRQGAYPRDASATAALPDTSPLPAQSSGSGRRWLESVDPATPADRAGAGSPTGLTGTPSVALVPILETTASCSAGLRSAPPLAAGS